MDEIIKSPSSFSDLKDLRRRILARYWREVDPIEGRKMMGEDARLLEAADAWLCWIIRIVEDGRKQQS